MTMNQTISCIRVMVAALFLVLFLSMPALAHKVMVFGWVEDGKVKSISKFSGGKRVKGGKIRVYDDSGAQVLEGVTDDNGEFAFDIPDISSGLKLELEAAMGHKNISLIPADQLGVAALAETEEAPVVETEKMPEAPSPVQVADVEKQMEKVLDKKVMPLLHSLIEKEDKPKLSDILGGIGYIIGLAGLFLYLRGRKHN